MNVYRRYFEITDAATLERINALIEARSAHGKSLKALAESLGAEDVYWRESGTPCAFSFGSKPDMSVWKSVEHGYMPRLNTKAGRALQAQIDAVGEPPGSVHSALAVAGLSYEMPAICGAGKAYRNSLCGWPGGRWFAVVPWYDEDPATLEKYKADRAAGVHFSRNLDHLQWTPPAEWIELKEWEVQKALDGAKEAAKAKEAA